MKQFSIALFGSSGAMACGIIKPLLEQENWRVLEIEKNSATSLIEEAFALDVLFLAIPRMEIDALFKGRPLRPNQLIIDISSYKIGLKDIFKDTGAQFLSVHPMNGPTTAFPLQKWLIIGEVPSHEFVLAFLDVLKSKHARLETIKSEEAHDKAMLIALTVPELLSIVFERLVFGAEEVHSVDTILNVAKLSSPCFAAALKTYLHAVYSTPLWLRKELLTRIDSNFLKRACDDLTSYLSNLSVPGQVDKIISNQQATLASIPEALESMTRSSVMNYFESLNDLAFGTTIEEHKGLTILKEVNEPGLLNIHSKIGIHGIAGSFSDEAWSRFASEHLGNTATYNVAELVYAENVLKAVELNEVDVGIVAFANSGSGGYVSTIDAMGKYSYNLIAMFTMPINMCILGHPSIKGINQIVKFFGHPVAISQCRKTINKRFPYIPIMMGSDEMDTALSAKLLATGQLPNNYAVFASERAAKIYGLKILYNGAQHDPSNATSFAIISHRKAP